MLKTNKAKIRQLRYRMSNKLKVTIAALCLLCLLLGAYIGFAAGPQPSSTFYISGGMYPGAPSYTIWREGSNYFAKDAYGQIEFSGTNATEIINNAITGLPYVSVQLPDPLVSTVSAPHGRILIKAGQYLTDSTIEIPLGARIMIEGEGTTQQMIKNGINGGTQIINSASTPALKALQKSGAVFCTGSVIYLKNIEFVQQVNLASSSVACIDLDGFAQGKLENVQAVSAYAGGEVTGIGIRLYTNYTVGDTNAPTIFEQVQVCGFNTGIYARIDLWESHFIEIANCSLALYWEVCLQNHHYSMHIFQVEQIMEVHSGFASYGHASIDGLYLEDIDDDTNTIKWNIYTDFIGMIYIENLNGNSCDSTYLWDVNATNPHGNTSLWFDKLMVTSSEGFPNVVTPGTGDGTRYYNDFMQLVEVYADWADIVTVAINGDTITTTDNKSITCLLRPGDYITIDEASADNYTWVWRAVSAENLHYLDP